MSLIPTSTVYTVKRGDAGTVVRAVQRALSDLRAVDLTLTLDGSYGRATEAAVESAQKALKLGADGVFGPNTSAAVAHDLQNQSSKGIPKGMLRSICAGESAELIGAVNWSVAGGVDCGYAQRRVYSADYNDPSVVNRAFDGLYQFGLLRRNLRSRFKAFKGRDAVDSREWAWRLAVLNHNYPYAADKISWVGIDGLSDYWRSDQDWVIAVGARFDNGDEVRTPLHWCRWYSLGAPGRDHYGTMVKYVKHW